MLIIDLKAMEICTLISFKEQKMVLLDDREDIVNLIETINDSGRLRLCFLSSHSIKLFHQRKGAGIETIPLF